MKTIPNVMLTVVCKTVEVKYTSMDYAAQRVGSNEHCVGSMSLGTQFMNGALF